MIVGKVRVEQIYNTTIGGWKVVWREQRRPNGRILGRSKVVPNDSREDAEKFKKLVEEHEGWPPYLALVAAEIGFMFEPKEPVALRLIQSVLDDDGYSNDDKLETIREIIEFA